MRAVYVCVRVCVRVRVRVCVRACVRVCVRACVRISVFAHNHYHVSFSETCMFCARALSAIVPKTTRHSTGILMIYALELLNNEILFVKYKLQC